MLVLRGAPAVATIEHVSLRKLASRRRRLLASALLAASASAGLALAAACGSDAASTLPEVEPIDAARDIQPVQPPDAAGDAAPPPPPPETTCSKYCAAVMKACRDEQAQYTTPEECLAFCMSLDLGDAGDTKSPSVACRAYYATSPAAIDPAKNCVVAGPYGGGVCGDRCTAYCEVALAVCPPDGGAAAPFASFPDCRDACQAFAFKDGGADGGGESPTTPASGDTLNCREYQLRRVIAAGAGCADLGVDSGACR